MFFEKTNDNQLALLSIDHLSLANFKHFKFISINGFYIFSVNWLFPAHLFHFGFTWIGEKSRKWEKWIISKHKVLIYVIHIALLWSCRLIDCQVNRWWKEIETPSRKPTKPTWWDSEQTRYSHILMLCPLSWTMTILTAWFFLWQKDHKQPNCPLILNSKSYYLSISNILSNHVLTNIKFHIGLLVWRR